MARILCIHAHPDDAEILAGGALALLAKLGHAVTICSMTAGDCGSAELGPEEIARVRRAEAGRAAALIGAEYVWGGFEDLAIFSCDESRRKVTELLRTSRPDAVLTASPEDYHCDHEATSALVRDACFAASAPNYRSGSAAALPAIPHLYLIDPVGGVDRFGQVVKPGFLVDVGTVFDLKRRMLAEHESQREWLRRQHGIDDYLARVEEWSRERGRLGGVEYAEGFRRYPGHPYPQTPLLEGLLKAHLTSE